MFSSTEWADKKEEREKAALGRHARLSALFRENRFLFELERKRMIAAVIDGAPDEALRTELRSFQESWDSKMKSAGSEHNRYVLAQAFFWEHFHERWQPALREISQRIHGIK